MENPTDEDRLLLKNQLCPSLILHTCNLTIITCGRWSLVINYADVAMSSSLAFKRLMLCINNKQQQQLTPLALHIWYRMQNVLSARAYRILVGNQVGVGLTQSIICEYATI